MTLMEKELTHRLVARTDGRWMVQNQYFTFELPASLGVEGGGNHNHAFSNL